MSYDEVEIEDMAWDEDLQAYTYSCPCGDLFQITLVRCWCCDCACGSDACCSRTVRDGNLTRLPLLI